MELSPFESKAFLLLFLAAVMHSFYLAILLFAKSQKERGLGWLGVMMLPVSVWLLTYLLYIGDVMRSTPHLLGVFVPLLYLMGPAYYFFIRRSSDAAHHFQWYDLLHLVPILYVSWEWLPLYAWPVEAKLALIEHVYTPRHPSFGAMFWMNRQIFLILGYVAVSYYFLKNRLQATDSDDTRIQWLLRFTLTFAGILCLDLFIKGLFWAFRWNATIMELLLVLILAVAIHILGYIVLGKDKVLPVLIRPSENIKYATSPLNSSQITKHRKAMISYLENERPWLNPDFSIHDLATVLQIPRHHLSQVLSEGMHKSFYDLICQYRIAEVKRRLQSEDVQKYSILGIATDCGFGSKSSFNRAFKKAIGMTPSAWLKLIPKQEISRE